MRLLYPVPEIDAVMLVQVREAAFAGIFDGRENMRARNYFSRCTWFHPASGAQLIYTRDTGHHSSGWIKNPDFESCLHLSLSFREPSPAWPANRLVRVSSFMRAGGAAMPRDFDAPAARAWAKAIFGDWARYAWIESAKSDIGRLHSVLHYRVFVGRDWEPIMPRGEVYSKRWTPADWHSWSELHGDDAPAPSHVDAS